MGGYIIGLYRKTTKVKRPYYRSRARYNTYSSRQMHEVGILYCIYRRNNSGRSSKDLYKRNIRKTRITSKDYIGLRSKVYIKILGNLYSGIRNLYSNVNSILSIDGRIDRKTKLNTRVVSKILY